MAYNGTGTFLINSSGQPAVMGQIITATAFNALTADLASGLSNCITRYGQGLPTASIPWNGQNLTGVNTLSMVTATISGNSTVGGTLGVTGTLTASGLVAAGSMTIGGNAVATQSFVTTSYAPLASPTFTGTPAAPTAAQGTATTQVATTAFVDRFYDIPRTTGGLTRGMCWAISTGFTLVTGAPAGSAYSIYNDSAAAITVTQGGGMTLRLAGTTTTGSRTVAPRAFATIWFNSTTEAVIMGNGVT